MHADLINKLGAGIVEGGHEAVGEPLQFGFITDVDLPGVGHAHGIQCTPPVHAQWSSMHQLCVCVCVCVCTCM